jgi:hypothetical protein
MKIKQMVEILMKRKEILPDDESPEQHYQKKVEEVREVEKDRTGPDGLFKGTFPLRKVPWRDEADGVMRCPDCGHEHEGGPACENCGIELDVDDFFSDIDDDFDADALEDLESGLEDIEVDAEFAERHPYLDLGDGRPPRWHAAFVQHVHNHHRYPTSDPSEGSDMDSDEEGSLQGFVVPDDQEPNGEAGQDPNNRRITTITISDDEDDESDEGGAVSNGRPRHRGRQLTPAAPSVISLTNTSVNDSEAGDEADMLRHAGWSPLDQGNDSDADGHLDYGYDGYHTAQGATEDERDSDDESDTNTETMAGYGYEDYEGREPSLTPSEEQLHRSHPEYHMFNPYEVNVHPSDEHFDADSELEISSDLEHSTDRDGDTDMTPSPRASRASRSVSVASTINANGIAYPRNPYSESRSSRGVSVSTNPYSEVSESSMQRFEEAHGAAEDAEAARLGFGRVSMAHELHDLEQAIASSDSSIRPRPRRLPRRYHPNSRGQQYDPRISMIFAEHQQSLRGTQNNSIGLDDLWDDEVRRVEPASRHQRRNSYRNMPARRVDPLRSSRSPSATRIIHIADRRSSRVPRQYPRRG